MPSFDIISEVNQVEVRNAIEQANKEISTRFDFKGSDSRVEHKEKELTLFADDEFKLRQVTDVVLGKLTKDSKLKVQGSIQGDAVRVSGAKRDELQEAIALVKRTITDFPVQFG